MLTFISVVRDFAMYERLLQNNTYTNTHTLHAIDNNQENKHITIRYNEFLNDYDYSQESWFVFCHEDWELKEDLQAKLDLLSKDNIYGPIGRGFKGCRTYPFNLIRRKRIQYGSVIHSNRDGSNAHETGQEINQACQVDTLDCQCIIVHSSLIQKYNLRFDENLSFDLYSEDFSINAIRSHQVKTYAIPILCQHWSQGSPGQRYCDQLAYLCKKYPDKLYAGTVSYIGAFADKLFKVKPA